MFNLNILRDNKCNFNRPHVRFTSVCLKLWKLRVTCGFMDQEKKGNFCLFKEFRCKSGMRLFI